MQPSSALIALVKNYEGFRSEPYCCPSGLPTIGYGHTRGVSLSDKPITEEQAEAYLREDLKIAVARVNRYVPTPLSQGQFDALVSFAFNTREEPFRNSTLVKLVNQRKFEDAAKEFDRWVFSNGKRLKGLQLRRRAERRMFEGLDWRV